MKRTMSVFLALVLALSAVSFTAFAEGSSAQSSTVTYSTSGSSAVSSSGSSSALSSSSASSAIPQVTKIEAVKTGAKLTWKAVSGAAQYRVFVKNGSSWKTLGDTAATSYIDTAATAGVKRIYTVRCLDVKGAYASSYNSAGWSNTLVAAPTVSKVETVFSGGKQQIKITWSRPAGAVNFRVFYKKGSSGWTKAGDTAATSYLFSSLSSGTKYSFTVRCLSADSGVFTSWYNESGKAINFVSMPTNVKIENTASGQKLSWTKPAGASKVRVFIKNGSSWKKLADTASSYVNTGVSSGISYTYTLRCLNANGSFISTYNSSGYTQTYFSAPKITKAEATSNGLKITWNSQKGAYRYRVFAKSGNTTGWTKLTDTAETSTLIQNLSNGAKLTFTVRVIDKNGANVSAYDTAGKTATYYETPLIQSSANLSTGVQFRFNRIKGVSQYRIFVKNGSSWKKLADTAYASYLYTGAKPGVSYSFTVRGMDAAGNYVTGYSSAGYTVTFRRGSSNVSDFEREVVRLINAERAKRGLPAMTLSDTLCEYARMKSQDMHDSGYFEHNSPNYGTPFEMIKSFGITYRAAGENLAQGYATPEAVMNGWMNSETHRNSILSPSYTRVGVGYVADGNYWTQWFIG